MEILRLCWHPNVEKIQRMEKKSWNMWMKIVNVYDGDTCTALCVFRGKLVRWRCRMFGYDCPELRSKIPEEKQIALLGKEQLKLLLNYRTRRPFRGHCRGIDKYGRLLLDVKVKGRPISEVMIEKNLAIAYTGGKKAKFEHA